MALDYIDFANQQRPTVDLGGIIAKALQMRQQTDAAAQDKQLNDLRMQGEQMKLADLMRTRQQEADLRNKIASAQPTVTQTPNPAYADWQQGTNRLADLTQQYEKAPVTGMDQNDYNSLAALSAKYSGAAPDTTLPVSTPPDYAAIIKQHALQNGDYGTYQKITQDEQKTRIGNSSAMLDTFTKLETAVKDGTMKPEDANALFAHFDTLHGSPLKSAGANVTFSSGGAYYSGPVKDTDLVSVNGRLQPLGQAGIATDFKVVGQGPNGETIYQMDKSSKFAELAADKHAGYKDRTRIVGDRTIFEESQDGGKTWKKVSEGPRYKPVGGNTGGGTGDETVQSWARAVREGRANLQDISNRGEMRNLVMRELERTGSKVDYAANKAENSAMGSSIAQQQKQLGAMGSFVKNLDAQVNKVEKLSKELSTFDTRLLNVPLRAVRGQIAGSPQQAKYDMYLTEIESEIGKLATGSSASAAELSIGAQQKWAKIHDKNLSIKDMLELLKETKEAGKMRMQSVKDQLAETKAQMRNRGGTASPTAKDPLGIL